VTVALNVDVTNVFFFFITMILMSSLLRILVWLGDSLMTIMVRFFKVSWQ